MVSGCFKFPSTPTSSDPHAQQMKLPLPTKDEVARVNGRPLSLQDFLTIRENLNEPSNQKAFWIGTAALALQDDRRSQGKEVTFRAAFELARYAMNDISVIQAASSI